MLINEKYLRNLIRQTLLNEAIYKQKDLNALSPELTKFISSKFEEINPKYSLDNDKSPGRFFIDVLYYCMEELLTRFNSTNISEDFVSKVEDICFYITMLFLQKDTKSSTVQTGESFNEYIYNFMLKPKDVIIKDHEDNPVSEIVRKLKFIYDNIMYRSKVSGIERLMTFQPIIKKKETSYPFGKDLVDGKYFVVCPLSTMSSIFWARTNYLAKDIVLPKQDDISWCTARFEGSNMFHFYFVGSGTNLYYFLPENDTAGKKKFCVGLTKIVDKGKEKILIGDWTTVNFANQKVLNTAREADEGALRVVSSSLNVSLDVLKKLVEKMKDKDPLDKYKSISLLDVDQFAAATNIDNVAPINPTTGKRSDEDLHNASAQINEVLDTYKNPEYINRGYKSDPKILNYITKKWMAWKKEGIKIKDEHRPESVLIQEYTELSLLSAEDFISLTKLNDKDSSKEKIGSNINKLLDTYNDPEYTKRGFKPSTEVLKYVEQNWNKWKKQGIQIKEIYKPESALMQEYTELSLLSIPDFISLTDLGTTRDKFKISEKINEILGAYKDPEYAKRGFKPNAEVLKYVSRKWYEWEKEGIKLKEKYKPDVLKLAEYTEVSLISFEKFMSIINSDNLAKNRSNALEISKEVNFILDIYSDPDYTSKGFKINNDILNYIEKNLNKLEHEGIQIEDRQFISKIITISESSSLLRKLRKKISDVRSNYGFQEHILDEFDEESFNNIDLIKEIFFQFYKLCPKDAMTYTFANNSLGRIFNHIKNSSVFDNFNDANDLLSTAIGSNPSMKKEVKSATVCAIYSNLSDTLKKNAEIMKKIMKLDAFYSNEKTESVAIYMLRYLKEFFNNNLEITTLFIKSYITSKYESGLINEIDPQDAYRFVQEAPGQDIFDLENPGIPNDVITKRLILDIINTNPKVFYTIYPNTKDFMYDDDIIMAVLKSHENRLLDLLVFVKKYYNSVNEDYSLFARILKEIPGSSRLLYDYCIDNLKNRYAIINYSNLVETAYYIYSASSNSDAVLNRYFGNEIAQQLKKEIMRIINPDSQNYLGKGVVDFFGSLLRGSSSDEGKNSIKTTKGTGVDMKKLKGNIEKISEKGKTINLEHFKKRNNKLIMTESELRRLISNLL